METPATQTPPPKSDPGWRPVRSQTGSLRCRAHSSPTTGEVYLEFIRRRRGQEKRRVVNLNSFIDIGSLRQEEEAEEAEPEEEQQTP